MKFPGLVALLKIKCQGNSNNTSRYNCIKEKQQVKTSFWLISYVFVSACTQRKSERERLQSTPKSIAFGVSFPWRSLSIFGWIICHLGSYTIRIWWCRHGRNICYHETKVVSYRLNMFIAFTNCYSKIRIYWLKITDTEETYL